MEQQELRFPADPLKGITPALCALFRLSPEDLLAAYQSRENYRIFTRRKKSGGTRQLVEAPSDLAKAQSAIATVLSRHLPRELAHDRLTRTVHGFVPGHSPMSNALRHRVSFDFFICDLKDAFGQIDARRLRELLVRYGFNAEEAELLTAITTFQGSLPQGAASSPVLLNYACRDLDLALKQTIRRLQQDYRIQNAWIKIADGVWPRLVYTRYADDLCLSSDYAELLDLAVPEFLRTIAEYGFVINPRKTRRLDLKHGSVSVTGLSVNGNGLKVPIRSWRGGTWNRYINVRLSRKRLGQYRSLLHHAVRGERSQEEVEGVLGWVRSVYCGSIPSQLKLPYARYRAAVAQGLVPLTRPRP